MGEQTTGKQRFLAGLPKKHFPGNKRLHMLNLGNRAYATTESDQHCFLGTQTQKHFLRKQNVSKKSQKHFFVYRKQKMFPQQVSFAHKRGNIETCFLNNVSATLFPHLRQPLSNHYSNNS